MRIYAVGDIHGCIGLLRTLHARIAEDAAQHPAKRKRIVYLGDYVDRGDDSRAVIDELLNHPLPDFEAIYLKGNHEDTLLRFLDDEKIGPAWLTYGGAAALFSYGVRPPERSDDSADLLRAQAELAKKLPPSHRAFLNTLDLSHTAGDYLFVHAGVRPHVPLEEQVGEDMMWIRDEFLLSDARFGKIVVHGHSIADRPQTRANRIGIDTGAFASGRLTCVVLDGANRSFLST